MVIDPVLECRLHLEGCRGVSESAVEGVDRGVSDIGLDGFELRAW